MAAGNNGVMAFFEMDKNLKLSSPLAIQILQAKMPDSQITSVYPSSDDSLISLITKNKKYYYNLLNTYFIDSDQNPIQPLFPVGFHTKPVTSVSFCLSKSLFATCAGDYTLKVWTLVESDSMEKHGIITKNCHAEPLSVSIHPNGLVLALCHYNKFVIYGILKAGLM